MNVFMFLKAALALAGGAAIAAGMGGGLARRLPSRGDPSATRVRTVQVVAAAGGVGFVAAAIGLAAAHRRPGIPHASAALLGSIPGTAVCLAPVLLWPALIPQLPLAWLALGLPGAAAGGWAAAVWRGGLRGTA